MSEVAELEKVYSAFEATARLVGAACSRDKVVPILTAYGDALTEAGIVFAVLSGEHNAGELDYTVTVPPGIDDPYAVARSNGFVAETDHPVGALLADLRRELSISEYLVDAGVVGGFKKIYAHFPQSLQKVSRLADIPSMPRAVAENAGLFARHGLADVAMIAIDYGRETVNLYFHRPPAPLAPETILSMVRESGLPEPSERALEFAQKAFRVNVTLGWDSSKIVRIALARFPGRSLDPSALSARIEPKFERFLRNTPHTYAGELINLLGLKWTHDGEIFEFASYHQLSPMQRKMWTAIHKEEV
jgi:hypothetical protein